MSWRDRAACKGLGQDRWFGPSLDEGGNRQHALERAAEKEAKVFCNGLYIVDVGLVREPCPVRAECLHFALRHMDGSGGEESGVWGGFTARKRRTMRRGDAIVFEEPVKRRAHVDGAEAAVERQGPADGDGPEEDGGGRDALHG